jgi:hypothetical protein
MDDKHVWSLATSDAIARQLVLDQGESERAQPESAESGGKQSAQRSDGVCQSSAWNDSAGH